MVASAAAYHALRFLHRSNVIEHITSQYGTRKEISISFIYYDYKRPELKDPSRIIAALIKQLCRRKDSIPTELLKFKRECLQPSLESLRELFTLLASSFQENFLMLDALDECPADERHHIIGFLTNLVEVLPNAKVFITSRKEGDIAEAFKNRNTPVIAIKAENVREDIEVFVRAEVKRLREGYGGKRLYLTGDSLEDTIVAKLSEKADGM